MDYRVDWGDGVFAVPDKAAECLRLASGKAVKVLIYYLKYKTVPADPGDIGVSAEDVEDALSYWQQTGLLSPKGDPASAETAPASPKQVTILAKPPQKPVPEKKKVSPPSKALLPSEIAQRIETCPDVAFMFKGAESELKRVMSFDDQRTLLWIHDHLGMPADCVIMIVAHCCRSGNSSMGKIQKAAEKMFDNDIITHEQVAEELLRLEKAGSYEGQIKSLLGLQTVTPNQRAYVNEWAEADISPQLVEKAYYISVENKGRAVFSYMNGIIRKWREGGVVTPEQADSFDDRKKPAAKKSSADKGDSPSYDISLMFES